MRAEERILIVGQGLAGTALAWRLWERGVPFVVVDRDEAVTCSKIAAGLVTPITGMRLNLNWRFESQRDEAVAFYEGVEKRVGERVYFPLKQVRLFRDEAARALFRRRMEDPVLARQVVRVDWGDGGDDGLLDERQFCVRHGGFEQSGGGYLDAEVYLREESVLALGGSWLATKAAIEGGRWEEISDQARLARELVKRVRGG
jgi:glycine/D-amino acid oxidase-like deaminating enzyme